MELAHDRASKGKGSDRHANGEPFDKQLIVTIQENLTPCQCSGSLYQIIKKCFELSRMAANGEIEAASKELLDVVNYAAAAHIVLNGETK